MKTSSSPTVIARGDAVYFIATSCEQYVKIGRSGDVLRRLKTLQTSSPLKLVLLGAIHAKPAYEKYLHMCFAKQRTHGEWFKFTDQLKQAVSRILDQPTFNFPEMEFAPEVMGVPITDFFSLFGTPKPTKPLDPLEEYLASDDYRRLMAERDLMTSDQLERLARLETAQVRVIRESDARGNEEVLHVCKITRLVMGYYPDLEADALADLTLLTLRRADESMRRAIEIIERDDIRGDDACAAICRQIAEQVTRELN